MGRTASRATGYVGNPKDGYRVRSLRTRVATKSSLDTCCRPKMSHQSKESTLGQRKSGCNCRRKAHVYPNSHYPNVVFQTARACYQNRFCFELAGIREVSDCELDAGTGVSVQNKLCRRRMTNECDVESSVRIIRELPEAARLPTTGLSCCWLVIDPLSTLTRPTSDTD